MSSRRKFLLTAGTAAIATAAMSNTSSAKEGKLVHHVFFWLKNPESKEDLAKLLEGIRSLEKIKALKFFKIGVPANTENRDEVDNSYNVSLLTIFDDVKGHDEYQVHPIHTAFVKNYSSLWTKVIVYDSADV